MSHDKKDQFNSEKGEIKLLMWDGDKFTEIDPFTGYAVPADQFNINAASTSWTGFDPDDLAEFEKAIADLEKEIKSNKHEGHNVVENTVLGKSFRYCRNCKVEV